MPKVLLLALLSRVPGITVVTVANRYKNILTATLGTWQIFLKVNLPSRSHLGRRNRSSGVRIGRHRPFRYLLFFRHEYSKFRKLARYFSRKRRRWPCVRNALGRRFLAGSNKITTEKQIRSQQQQFNNLINLCISYELIIGIEG
jgi:hypothetical protein